MKNIFSNLLKSTDSNGISYPLGLTKKIRNRNKLKKFYSQFISKGQLSFDIGANVGNRTEILVELGAKVVCVEPQKICLDELERQFGNNPDVIIVKKAVSDVVGTAEIAICKEAPTISTMSKKWQEEGRFSNEFEWSETEEIPTTTLDVLIEKHGSPTFCKIDVEGFELNVIRGLSSPLPIITFEFTREFFSDAKDCLIHLASIGAIEVNCSLGESMELLFTDWVTPEELYKKLDLNKVEDLWGDIYVKGV